MRSMPPLPTRELIENGAVGEDAGHDFKQRLDLDAERGKTKLVDDVVAFLNAGPGYLIIGVAEEKGRFRHFEPLRGDPDAFERRLLSTVQDNIDPRPLRVEATHFPVGDGFVFVLHVPWHGRRAFQNRITGGFLTRTGAKNTPLSRYEVQALFTPEETFQADVIRFVEREDKRCLDRELMQEKGPTFHLGVVPAERYETGRAPFDRGRGVLKCAPHFHGGWGTFTGCEDGQETLEITFDRGRAVSRLFIDDDWSLFAQVEHPFRAEEGSGRVTLHEFGRGLPTYLAHITELYGKEGIVGPFCVAMAVRNLRRNPKVAWLFPNADALAVRPALVDRVDDEDLVERFNKVVRRGSRYAD